MDEKQIELSEIHSKLVKMDANQLQKVNSAIEKLNFGPKDNGSISKLDWPHAPMHRLSEEKGTFFVTAATLGKQHVFESASMLDEMRSQLLMLANQYSWNLEAWALFSNHYHFIGNSEESSSLKKFLTHFHASTARHANEFDDTPGRRVWFNFWETELTFERSYFARLNYVHQNAVHHRLVQVANQYAWCSAAWFERMATPAQVKTIYGFKIDKLKIDDDFEVLYGG